MSNCYCWDLPVSGQPAQNLCCPSLTGHRFESECLWYTTLSFPIFSSFWKRSRLRLGIGAEGVAGKGKHLSNLQRPHWYVEWTLVCGLWLRLFQGKTISFLSTAGAWANTTSQAILPSVASAIGLTSPVTPAENIEVPVFLAQLIILGLWDWLEHPKAVLTVHFRGFM